MVTTPTSAINRGGFGPWNIPKEDIPILAKETVKVFNANTGVRNPEQQVKTAVELIKTAW